MRLRTRRAGREDDDAVAALYRTFRRRPLEAAALRWAFEDSPGGRGDQWVVEAEHGDGTWVVVGHHGLVPIRCRWNGGDIVVGKTAKTLVLPEYRPHLLYLRFERDCLKEVASKYHATYSFGVGAARMRQALGYAGRDVMLVFERALLPPGLAWRALARATPGAQRRLRAWTDQGLRALAAAVTPAAVLQLEELPADAARSAVFFDDLGNQAERPGIMTPGRSPGDLAWRFWNNPAQDYVALTHTSPGGAKSCCIVNTSNPWRLAIEDVVLPEPRPDVLVPLLSSVFAWAARRGALMMSLMTTSTGQPPELLDCLGRLMRPALRAQLARYRLPGAAEPPWDMPRRIGPPGAAVGLDPAPWQVTSFLKPL
jgi:hypothetical protein